MSKKKKQKTKSETANAIAAQLAAFQASQNFHLSQKSAARSTANVGPTFNRVKKRGNR